MAEPLPKDKINQYSGMLQAHFTGGTLVGCYKSNWKQAHYRKKTLNVSLHCLIYDGKLTKAGNRL